MAIWVTGGAGYIGSVTVDRLRAKAGFIQTEARTPSRRLAFLATAPTAFRPPRH